MKKRRNHTPPSFSKRMSQRRSPICSSSGSASDAATCAVFGFAFAIETSLYINKRAGCYPLSCQYFLLTHIPYHILSRLARENCIRPAKMLKSSDQAGKSESKKRSERHTKSGLPLSFRFRGIALMLFIKPEAGASDSPRIIEIGPLRKHIGIECEGIDQITELILG